MKRSAWAWNKFSKNLGPLVLAALVYGVIGVVVHGLVFVLLGGATADTTNVDGDYGASFPAGLGAVGTLVLSIVSFVFGIFVQAAIPLRADLTSPMADRSPSARSSNRATSAR